MADSAADAAATTTGALVNGAGVVGAVGATEFVAAGVARAGEEM